MAIEFKREALNGTQPAFWRGESKVLPAGFKAETGQNLPFGVVFEKGTPVRVNHETRSAAVCKAAKVLDGSTSVSVKLAKGHFFVAGDNVTIVDGDLDAVIVNIDKSNAAYDTITTNVEAEDEEAVTAGAILVESEAGTAGAEAVEPNAVLEAAAKLDESGFVVFDVAYQAAVLYKNISTPILDNWLNGFCMKNNPNIIFITQ